MSNSSFYANQLVSLLSGLPKFPIAIFPGFDSNPIRINFSGLDKISNFNKAYKLFKYIIAKDAWPFYSWGYLPCS